MDYTRIGFGEMWEDEAKARRKSEEAKWHAGIFAIFGTNLLFSIIRTISTSPGTIPDNKEWDMESGQDDDELVPEFRPELNTFTNAKIERNT